MAADKNEKMTNEEHESDKVLSLKTEEELREEIESRMVHLEKKASRKIHRTLRHQMNDFTEFLREQSVVGIAVGLVLGTQIKSMVDQFVDSFVNPAVGLIFPGTGNLGQKSLHLSVDGRTQIFAWGAFVSTLISFLLITGIIYYTIKILKLDRLKKRT